MAMFLKNALFCKKTIHFHISPSDFEQLLTKFARPSELRKTMEIQVVNRSKHSLPNYETELSAGMDLRANIENDIELKSLKRILIPTGLFIALPKGTEAQIRPRSGLAYKYGLTVLNTPGTIDADYRGEVKVLLVNLSNESFVIKNGERIAQMVIAKHEQPTWKEVKKLDETIRGEGGFGHTGKN